MAVIADVRGQGGLQVGGTAGIAFTHGQVGALSDIVVEVDWDNDGDFDQPGEDVTGHMVECGTLTGRDYPSQLTGKAGPGQLRMLLRNDDGRFSFFSQASPLNTSPNSLASGRKIRARTTTAPNPDPQLLARDRFAGTGGLGADEQGNPWADQTPGAAFQRLAGRTGATLAVPQSKGSVHIATVDAGAADLYAQVRYLHVDTTSNRVGLVYRFQDASNYGAVYVESGAVVLAEVTAGILSVTASAPIEQRHDVAVGALISGAQATVLVDGVAMFTDDARNDTDTHAGIYSLWVKQRAPALHELHVWDGLPVEVEGVLWTGWVTKIEPDSPLGPNLTATLSAEGVLATVARTDVQAPESIGVTSTSVGVTTGLLAGNTLASAGQLHPPGPIDQGDVTTGAVGLPDGKALGLLRQFEEVEWGFLHETQDGQVGFESRGARAGRAAQAWFSDGPAGQFGYDALRLGEWRRDVINRVTARLSPKVPKVSVVFGGQASAASNTADVTVVTPEAVAHGAAAGDLFLVIVISSVGSPGVEWEVPVGWKSFRDAKDFLGRQRVYARVLSEADIVPGGATYLLYDNGVAGGAWHTFMFLIKDWHGSLDQGIVVAEHNGFGPPASVAEAHAGLNDPPAVFPAWGPAPSLFIVTRAGATAVASVSVAAPDDDLAPGGYGSMNSAFVNSPPGGEVAQQYALREGPVTVEDPSPFAPGAEVFGGFEVVEATTIAVRGFAGDPPEASRGQAVQVDDLASQANHNAIRSHDNQADLFASADDAEAYGQAVLVRHASDRPVLTLSFAAHTSAAYRAQALRRRVGHKIRVTAANTTGAGIDRDFFIESIAHRFTKGGTAWDVTWQLSPA